MILTSISAIFVVLIANIGYSTCEYSQILRLLHFKYSSIETYITFICDSLQLKMRPGQLYQLPIHQMQRTMNLILLTLQMNLEI